MNHTVKRIGKYLIYAVLIYLAVTTAIAFILPLV